MRTYRGIVCEINKSNMIFMTSDGEFLIGVSLTKNPHIGDEVDFVLAASTPMFNKKKKSFIIGPALVAAALFVFFVASLLTQTNSAYAYVHLDNDVEFAVNEDGNVISVRSLSKQNTITIDDLEGLPIEVALSKAINNISSENEQVSITTEYEKESPKLKEQIEEAVKEAYNKQSELLKNENNSNTEQKSNGNAEEKQQQKIEDTQTENSDEKQQPSSNGNGSDNSVDNPKQQPNGNGSDQPNDKNTNSNQSDSKDEQPDNAKENGNGNSTKDSVNQYKEFNNKIEMKTSENHQNIKTFTNIMKEIKEIGQNVKPNEKADESGAVLK